MPQVLLPVIPHMTSEMLAEDPGKRAEAMQLVCQLFSVPGNRLVAEYGDVFDELLHRFKDAEVGCGGNWCANFCLWSLAQELGRDTDTDGVLLSKGTCAGIACEWCSHNHTEHSLLRLAGSHQSVVSPAPAAVLCRWAFGCTLWSLRPRWLQLLAALSDKRR